MRSWGYCRYRSLAFNLPTALEMILLIACPRELNDNNITGPMPKEWSAMTNLYYV